MQLCPLALVCPTWSRSCVDFYPWYIKDSPWPSHFFSPYIHHTCCLGCPAWPERRKLLRLHSTRQAAAQARYKCPEPEDSLNNRCYMHYISRHPPLLVSYIISQSPASATFESLRYASRILPCNSPLFSGGKQGKRLRLLQVILVLFITVHYIGAGHNSRTPDFPSRSPAIVIHRLIHTIPSLSLFDTLIDSAQDGKQSKHGRPPQVVDAQPRPQCASRK